MSSAPWTASGTGAAKAITGPVEAGPAEREDRGGGRHSFPARGVSPGRYRTSAATRRDRRRRQRRGRLRLPWAAFRAATAAEVHESVRNAADNRSKEERGFFMSREYDHSPAAGRFPTAGRR